VGYLNLNNFTLLHQFLFIRLGGSPSVLVESRARIKGFEWFARRNDLQDDFATSGELFGCSSRREAYDSKCRKALLRSFVMLQTESVVFY